MFTAIAFVGMIAAIQVDNLTFEYNFSGKEHCIMEIDRSTYRSLERDGFKVINKCKSMIINEDSLPAEYGA